MDILSQVGDEISAMSDEDIKAAMAQLQEAKAKQSKRQAEYNSSPEAKAKRAAYNAERSQNPEVKAKRAEYMQRPEVKEKMKAYRQKRNARNAAILARAKELGIEG